MTSPRITVVGGALLVVLAACGPADTSSATSSTTTTGQPAATTAAPTTSTTTSTTPTTRPPTTTTTTAAPSGPLVLLATQPVVRGNLYTNPGAVVEIDGTFHMYRNQFSAWPGKSNTYHLVSTDGLEWEDRGVVFDTEAVPFTEGNAFIMDVIPGADGWVGWFYTYEGSREPGFIGRVTAPDPDGPWVADTEPVLSPGPEGAWDGVRVIEPTVLREGDGYVMFYAGIGDDRRSAIGRATSADGITWVKHDDPSTDDPRFETSDPVFTGDVDSWNVGSVGCPDVVPLAEGYMMIFDSAAARGYARAVSSDGITWEVVDQESLIRQETSPNRQPFWQSELLWFGDRLRFYLEVGLGTGPTNIFAFDLEAPRVPPMVDADLEVDGDSVTITVEASGFDLRFVRGDISGATLHPHVYVDRDPPESGDLVPVGRDDVVHAVGDTIRLTLEPGDHVLWLVLADGADRAVTRPEPIRFDLMITE